MCVCWHGNSMRHTHIQHAPWLICQEPQRKACTKLASYQVPCRLYECYVLQPILPLSCLQSRLQVGCLSLQAVVWWKLLQHLREVQELQQDAGVAVQLPRLLNHQQPAGL